MEMVAATWPRDVLDMLPSPQRTFPNLFAAYAPFRVDGDLGAAGDTE